MQRPLQLNATHIAPFCTIFEEFLIWIGLVTLGRILRPGIEIK